MEGLVRLSIRICRNVKWKLPDFFKLKIKCEDEINFGKVRECFGRQCFQVLQLYQITELHHGLMMVGPSGSGKTTAWKVLLKALERLEGVEGVAHVIDPKAISKDDLYGVLDPNTREWTDGLFTHILRKCVLCCRIIIVFKITVIPFCCTSMLGS